MEQVLALHAQTHYPDSFLLEKLQCSFQIGDPGHGCVFQGSGRCFVHSRGQRCRTIFWNNHSMGAAHMSGSDQGAKILGILDAIQYQDKSRSFIQGSCQNGFHLGVGIGG